MPNTPTVAFARRLGSVVLFATPLVAAGLGMSRSLRVPVVHQTIGGLVFAAICVAAWVLAARAISAGSDTDRVQALAGGLLVIPFALISLLWVGLATPWDATAPENQMRYLVLLAGSVGVTVGIVVLAGSLRDAGERLYSGLGLGAGLLAGAAYLVWLTMHVGAWTARARTGEIPEAVVSLNDALDTLVFVACALTYLATAAFALSFQQTGWLGPRAGGAFVLVSIAALALVIIRGLSFPDPTAGSTPWYTRPGFIAGIPAVPWIMPHLLEAALLRRAGADPLG